MIISIVFFIAVTLLKDKNELHQDYHLYFILLFLVNVIMIMILLKMHNDVQNLDDSRV